MEQTLRQRQPKSLQSTATPLKRSITTALTWIWPDGGTCLSGSTRISEICQSVRSWSFLDGTFGAWEGQGHETSQDKIVSLLEQARKLPDEPEAKSFFRFSLRTLHLFDPGCDLNRASICFASFPCFHRTRAFPIKGHQFFRRRPWRAHGREKWSAETLDGSLAKGVTYYVSKRQKFTLSGHVARRKTKK